MCTVSILVPVYNVAPYLRTCIDSILNQTYSDFELLLCDDGSTDESGSICDEYAKADARVRVIHQKNAGNSAARRVLLSQCQGEYVLFVDSDDWISTDTLESIVCFAKKNDIDIVMYSTTYVDDEGNILRALPPLYPDGSVFRGEECRQVYHDFISGTAMNHLWDKLIARRLFSNESDMVSNLHRSFKGEDKLKLIPVFEGAKSFAYLSTPVYYYRLSANGLGRNFKMHYFPDARFVQNRVLRFIDRKLDASPAEKSVMYRSYLESLGYRIICCAHNRDFSIPEILQAYDEERQSKECRETLQNCTSVSTKLLNRYTIWMFRHNADKPLIHSLRLEQRIITALRRIGIVKRR